jgi:hypothetical protein
VDVKDIPTKIGVAPLDGALNSLKYAFEAHEKKGNLVGDNATTSRIFYAAQAVNALYLDMRNGTRDGAGWPKESDDS